MDKVEYDLNAIDVFHAPFIKMVEQKTINLQGVEKPVFGWFSIYTPEEIIYASGIIPFRIMGGELSVASKARALLFSNLCPYVLSTLDEGLDNSCDFLSGAVIVNACDARRRLFDAWRIYVKTRFIYLIDLPKSITEESTQYFIRQLRLFKEAIEVEFGLKISQKSLFEAIELWNDTRELLQKLYRMRISCDFPLSGSQVLTIVKASMSGQREEFNKNLSSLLTYLASICKKEDKILCHDKKIRIIITGSYFDQNSLIDLIEGFDAVVVCEDLSNGIKYFEGKVDLNKEPIVALADYYLTKTTCARMIDSENRYNHIKLLIKNYRIDAVIYFSLKFCDNNLIDYPYQRQKLVEDGIPVLFIEGERMLINLNQLKTRIQAFLEMI